MKLQETRSCAYYAITPGTIVYLRPSAFGNLPSEFSGVNKKSAQELQREANRKSGIAAWMASLSLSQSSFDSGIDEEREKELGRQKAARAGVLGEFTNKTKSHLPKVFKRRKATIYSDDEDDSNSDGEADAEYERTSSYRATAAHRADRDGRSDLTGARPANSFVPETKPTSDNRELPLKIKQEDDYSSSSIAEQSYFYDFVGDTARLDEPGLLIQTVC